MIKLNDFVSFKQYINGHTEFIIGFVKGITIEESGITYKVRTIGKYAFTESVKEENIESYNDKQPEIKAIIENIRDFLDKIDGEKQKLDMILDRQIHIDYEWFKDGD